MLIVGFQVIDELGQIQFFQEKFLLVNSNIKMVLEIFFFTFNNADI